VRSLVPLLLIPLAAATAIAAPNADLSSVQSVYILPMSNGFDQYLANHLTRLGLFQIVTDPERADAFFSDRIGEALQVRFDAIEKAEREKAEQEQAKAAEAASKAAEDSAKKTEASDTKAAKDGDAPVIAPVDAAPPRVSNFNRAKGTTFLVDRRSRRVLWSIYERPKNTTPDELDRTAARLAARLKEAHSGK